MSIDGSDELLVAAQQGEPAALRGLYERLAPRVRGYLIARGVDDPDGTTNDVFLRLFLRLGSVTGGIGGLRALAFTIAHGLAVDDARRRRRRPTSTPYDTEDDTRTSVSAEETALEHTRTSEMFDVLHLLPDDQRDVVILRVLGELSITETAAAIGRTESTVKRLQSAALETLRHLLERPAHLTAPGNEESDDHHPRRGPLGSRPHCALRLTPRPGRRLGTGAVPRPCGSPGRHDHDEYRR